MVGANEPGKKPARKADSDPDPVPPGQTEHSPIRLGGSSRRVFGYPFERFGDFLFTPPIRNEDGGGVDTVRRFLKLPAQRLWDFGDRTKQLPFSTGGD
jgi:hypothetical protein